MSRIRQLTPLEEKHAAALARWFWLNTAASRAPTARALRRLKAELAEVDHELAALERQIAAQAQSRAGGSV